MIMQTPLVIMQTPLEVDFQSLSSTPQIHASS
jgi:hypothetical protein